MKYDVFISYSRKDTNIANRICQALDKANINYFIDKQGINGGFEFPVIIANAIIESKIILYLASENSYKSKFTNAELTFAFNEKPQNCIIPYIIDNSELPKELRFMFSNINWRRIEEYPIETSLIEDLKALIQGQSISRSTNSAPRKNNLTLWVSLLIIIMFGGIIYYNTTATEKAEDTATKNIASTSKYQIGDYYHKNGLEGIIFDIDSTGEHGKILSLQQTSEKINWCTFDASINHAGSFGATDNTDGMVNMKKITQLANWKEIFPAFSWCAALGDQWYLPSIEELKIFTENKEIIIAANKTLKERGCQLIYDIGEVTTYWSSTEAENANAWTVVMTIGKANPYIPRYNISHVRAIARF